VILFALLHVTSKPCRSSVNVVCQVFWSSRWSLAVFWYPIHGYICRSVYHLCQHMTSQSQADYHPHRTTKTPLHSTPLTGRAIKPQRQGHLLGPLCNPECVCVCVFVLLSSLVLYLVGHPALYWLRFSCAKPCSCTVGQTAPRTPVSTPVVRVTSRLAAQLTAL